MSTKKSKRGITIIELLGGVVLMGILTTLVTTITVFVSRGTKIVSENSTNAHISSNISLVVLNQLTTMSVTDCVSKTEYGNTTITFSSRKQNYIYKDASGAEQVGTLYLDTITDDQRDLWVGPVSIAFAIAADKDALMIEKTDIYGETNVEYCEFEHATVIADESYVTIANSQDDNSWFFEIKVQYQPDSRTGSSTFYNSIYVTDTDKNN